MLDWRVSAYFFETYASKPPARKAPMIHGIQLRLRSGRLSVRSRTASFGGILADVPLPGCNDSLAA